MKTIQGGSSGSSTRSSATRKPYNVLFVCPDNATCSVIAEAILRRRRLGDFQAFSAGIDPKPEKLPVAAEFLKARQVWDDKLRSKHCREFLGPDSPPMDFIISLGERLPAGLPTEWPGQPKLIHWHITEPVTNGGVAQTAVSFRKTFTELENRIRLFVLVYEREASKRAAAA
jgi:protein-tyrosine-phosphatase